MSDLPITVNGFKNIKIELDDLIHKQRPNIVKAIAAAREHGDLKENAEYHSAREKQSFIEGRILELEDKVARARIIDPTTIKDKAVRFSATVSLIDCNTEKEVTYTLVSEYEADIKNNLISITSPIARGLINKEVGDEAVIATPKGEKIYEILDIQYK
jgi:transcription elongation factor GreA